MMLLTTGACAAGLVVVLMVVSRMRSSSAVPGLVAILVVSVASVAGAVPLCLALAHDPGKAPLAALGATAIRFLVVLFFVAILLFTKAVPLGPLVGWASGSYLVFLAADTVVATRMIRSVSEVK